MNRQEMCFALKNKKEFYVANGACYALADHHARKMRIEGKCCTKGCPFYKPYRNALRCGDEIKDWIRRGDE